MTLWIWILLIVSAALGIPYTLLGLRAHDYLNEKASISDRSIGWLFWWLFAKDKYDGEGKRLCAIGQLLAYVLLAIYAAWYFILLK